MDHSERVDGTLWQRGLQVNGEKKEHAGEFGNELFGFLSNKDWHVAAWRSIWIGLCNI